MIHCSCLCKEIEFEAEEIPGMIFNCHCQTCRKSNGAAYATQVLAQRSSLQFKRGQHLLSEFETSNAMRAFCSHCGSRLMNYGKGEGEYLSIAISAINGRISQKPIGECFAGEKLNFVELNETIPHYHELPDIPIS